MVQGLSHRLSLNPYLFLLPEAHSSCESQAGTPQGIQVRTTLLNHLSR